MAVPLSRIPSLDGLRAVSIALVVVSHLVYTHGVDLPAGIDRRWFDGLSMLGVRVFFVISGFLITRLLFHELDATGKISLRQFYFRRTLRIFVPYYAFLAVAFGLDWLGGLELQPRDVLHALTYTVNYFPDRAWVIGHAWSLSLEEQFYLFWPLVLVVAGKRTGLKLALAFVLLAPFIRLAYSYLSPELVRYELGYRFETASDAVATGCLLAAAYDRLARHSLWQWIAQSGLLAVVPIMVVGASLMDVTLKRYLLFGVTAQNIGIAVCIAWCVSHPGGWAGRILNVSPVAWVGRMSYSIYLWQQLFLNPYSDGEANRYPLNLALVAIVSTASYVLVERPSLALRQRLENKLFATGPRVAERGPRGEGFKHG